MSQATAQRADSSGVNRSVRNAALGLLALVPAPTLGTLMGMIVLPGTLLGQGIYGFSKVWILALPVAWLLLVDRGRLSFSPTKAGPLLVGAALGIVIGAAILAVYAAIGDQLIDAQTVRRRAIEIGLDTKARYLALAGFLTLVNALLEEYVWRWFVFRQCEVLVGSRPAVVLSAALFTIHHVVALSVQMPAAATALCSTGVFIGGAVWSACYLRYRSIWPGYLSHAIVDATVFFLGWKMIFG